MKRPSYPEIKKFILLLKGCRKDTVKAEWMKEMLNWDLFTHPKAEAFAKNSSNTEKLRLACEWKKIMDTEGLFISFYEWNSFYKRSGKAYLKPLVPQKAKSICCPVQALSVSDLGREINKLKKAIKETSGQEKGNQEQNLQIEHQKFHILIDLKIQGMPFKLKTLIDTGSDLNMLHKDIIPVSLWQKTQALVVGLGNIPNDISFQIPEAILCFQDYCLKLKFLLADIPIACILGTPFLAAVAPHGSTMVTPDKPGYFISIPSPKGKVMIKLPFVSTPRVSDMVQLTIRKSLKIEELKTFQSGVRIKDQLKQKQIQEKISLLQKEFINTVCSENPTAFWKQRKHEVSLPYKEEYQGKPCKSRAIPMNVEYQKLCAEEIKGLLSKDLIRESTSPVELLWILC
jgi:hypothetical protein